MERLADRKLRDHAQQCPDLQSRLDQCATSRHCRYRPVEQGDADLEAVEEYDKLTERLIEARHMFELFASRLFHQRVQKAFLECIADLKQQRLLEEEEAH